MRILYVCRSLAYWGGIERILVDKMNHLVTMYGYEVFMLTTDQGDHPVPYQLEEKVCLEDLDIRLHQQYRYHGIKKLYVAQRKERLFSLCLSNRLQSIKPDVIVCTTANYTDINVISRLKGNIPLIVESHSIFRHTFGQKGLRNRYADYMYCRGLSKSQMIVALTEGDADEWRKEFPDVCVIPNMVHLNKDEVASLDQKRVIWVGRFDYQKRPMEILRIWKEVYPQFPDWHLDLYGEGELQEELEEKARLLNMNAHVHRPTAQIFNAFRQSSVLVSTSLFEPFGLVIPEAMSCGLPVIAYDCPYGPSAIIKDGQDGFLIGNNDVQAFANSLCLLMKDLTMRQKMGHAAIASSSRYAAERIMPKWKSLFEKFAVPKA